MPDEKKPDLPTEIAEVDRVKLDLFQERLTNVGLRVALLQEEMKAIQVEQSAYVKSHLKPTYKLGDGDQVDAHSGKITRKGDPNLTITRPLGLVQAPPPEKAPAAG